MKKKMKAILSYLLVLAMVFSMLPAMSAKAEEYDGTGSAPTSYVGISTNGGFLSGEYTYGDPIEDGVWVMQK